MAGSRAGQGSIAVEYLAATAEAQLPNRFAGDQARQHRPLGEPISPERCHSP